jgi:hypothetical protein
MGCCTIRVNKLKLGDVGMVSADLQQANMEREGSDRDKLNGDNDQPNGNKEKTIDSKDDRNQITNSHEQLQVQNNNTEKNKHIVEEWLNSIYQGCKSKLLIDRI